MSGGRSNWSRVRVAAAVTTAGVVGAALALPVGCRDATQVSVALRAGPGVCAAVGPAADKRTEVFVGSPRSPLGDPRARLEGCGADDLGTFTLVPSGKEGDVLVEVVMALSRGKSSDACRADPKDCIVARRRVAFVGRRSLRMSVTLDPQCIGVTCDPDSTCFAGRCRPADTACGGDECDLPTGDGGAPPDAALDASADTGDLDAGDAGATCPVPSGVVTHVAGTGDLLYLTDEDRNLRRLDVTTRKDSPVGILSSRAVVLAAGGGRAVAASETEIFIFGPSLTKVGAPAGPPVAAAVLDEPAAPITYAYATELGLHFSAHPPYMVPMQRLVAGKEFYAVGGSTIYRGVNPSGLAQHAAASVPHLLAVGPDNAAYWSSAASDVFLAGFPTHTPVASLPGLEAMTTRGDLWVGAKTVVPDVGWGYDLFAARIRAGGTLSLPTKFGELRGLGAQPVQVELAIAGPCVYALSGPVIAAARYP